MICFNLLLNHKKTFLALFAAFVVSFIIFYIIQVNNMATQGFEVRKLEDEITQLKNENKQFQLQVVQLQSMANLKQRAEKLNLVEATDIRYLDITGAAFAQK